VIGLLRWPTLSEWGVIALMLIVFFIGLFAAMALTVEVLARRDVRSRRDRSR
jgi:hypothetical protein